MATDYRKSRKGNIFVPGAASANRVRRRRTACPQWSIVGGMARVLVTGSADGLGRAAARTLLDEGHDVVVHARGRERLAAVAALLDRGAAAVVGDLADPEQTRGVAEQVNELGP